MGISGQSSTANQLGPTGAEGYLDGSNWIVGGKAAAPAWWNSPLVLFGASMLAAVLLARVLR